MRGRCDRQSLVANGKCCFGIAYGKGEVEDFEEVFKSSAFEVAFHALEFLGRTRIG